MISKSVSHGRACALKCAIQIVSLSSIVWSYFYFSNHREINNLWVERPLQLLLLNYLSKQLDHVRVGIHYAGPHDTFCKKKPFSGIFKHSRQSPTDMPKGIFNN